jgi:hypothetical protein
MNNEGIIQKLLYLSGEVDRLKDRVAALESERRVLRIVEDKEVALPDYLYKTYLHLKALNVATAGDVACRSGYSRAVESAHLNQLVRQCIIFKWRKERKIFFGLKLPEKKHVPL